VQDGTPAKEVARGLLKRGLLTRFQAERLLEGRFRGFFIDHYKVLEILGAGGMACLYLAEDLESGALVALKVISDKHKNDAGMLTRLKIEARAGKKLNHPGIIHTYDIHKTDDVFGEALYLVMEYVEGINLEELINLKGPIQWEQAADFVHQAAAGLGHAHAAGLIHRDVKPGNLLVDARGTIKILDFGLALLDSHEDADEFSLAMIFGHSCLGTADYIAPEQSVDSFAVDSRADIYGLGCTLYVALTGKLPYPMAASSQKLDGHRRQPAPPIRNLAPTVPEGLAAVVEKMMAKLPADRYQSMAEVVEALAPFARRQPVEFDFPKILAWRAKDARRRYAGTRRTGDSSGPALRSSSSPSRPTLRSASTRRFPEGAAETAVAPESGLRHEAVALGSPFDWSLLEGSLSRPELSAPSGRQGPLLVPVDGGPAVPLHGRRFVIGRNDDNDLRISSGMVSGKHCELLFDGSVWRVHDLESKNGTQVNGIPVTEQVLLPGQQLTVAQQFRYRVEYTVAPRPMQSGPIRWTILIAVAVGLAVAGVSIWWQLTG
jgi:serine/threonine protein kinase